MQVLKTEDGKIDSYRPFQPLNKNLKVGAVWNSVEVHAIYSLVYTLCMSKEGLDQFKHFISAEDQQLFDPLFIAHYLLVPVNTIVKNTLLPWMMKTYEPPTKKTRCTK